MYCSDSVKVGDIIFPGNLCCFMSSSQEILSEFKRHLEKCYLCKTYWSWTVEPFMCLNYFVLGKQINQFCMWPAWSCELWYHESFLYWHQYSGANTSSNIIKQIVKVAMGFQSATYKTWVFHPCAIISFFIGLFSSPNIDQTSKNFIES